MIKPQKSPIKMLKIRRTLRMSSPCCSMFVPLVLPEMMVEQHLQHPNNNYSFINNNLIICLPKNVPNANGYSGTPITGATRFINQFGKNGVIRKNSI